MRGCWVAGKEKKPLGIRESGEKVRRRKECGVLELPGRAMLTGAQQHSLSSAACTLKFWEIQTEEDSRPSPCRPKQPLNSTIFFQLPLEMEISFDLPPLGSGFRRHKSGLWPFFRGDALQCCNAEEVK